MTERSWKSDAVRVIMSLVLLCGLGIGFYLAWHHENQLFGDATAKLGNCPESDTINCEIVNTSKWSQMFGVPIAAYAIPTYLLLLILVWGSRARPSFLAYTFCIGLLTSLFSLFLFYISKTEIGYLCLWCMRLYGINLAIPVLAALAAWRSPLALLKETIGDLKVWPRALRFTAAAFAVFLSLTVIAQQGYRADLKHRTAEEIRRIMSEGGPTIPAVPDSEGTTPSGTNAPTDRDPDPPSPDPASSSSGVPAGRRGALISAGTTIQQAGFMPFSPPVPSPTAAMVSPPARPAKQQEGTAPTSAGGPYILAGPVRRVQGGKTDFKAEPFDLQARIGHGKPVALVFWAPGFHQSERALADWAAFFKQTAAQFDLYAVAGRGESQRDEEIWEIFSMLGLPADLPLLVDDGFKISNALEVSDVPNLTLFDAKGALVIAKIKHRAQLLMVPPANATAEAVIKRIAAGETIATIKRMFPYYPATELYNRRAPEFTLKKFNKAESYTFAPQSAAKRPRMLMFWSSTCKHCQVEIPQLVTWVKTHPGVLDIISVTHIKADRPGGGSHRKITEAYIRSQGISWTVLEDPDHAVEDLYGIVSTPTTYFIAADGRVSNAWFYAHEVGFDEAIAKELALASSGQSLQPTLPRTFPRMDFMVAGGDGKRVALPSLIDRPSLVHFWASWCKPCVEEIPSLVRFRDKLEKDGAARVILISVEDESASPEIARFQKKLGLDLRSYRAPRGGLADKVDLSYRLPRTYLMDSGGAVLGLRQGGQNWDDPTLGDKVRSRLQNGGATAEKR